MKKGAAAAILLMLAGCATAPGRGGAPEAVFSRQFRHELMESLQERNQAVRTLRGLSSVRYGSRLFGVSGEAAILLKTPYYLRMDGLSEFGLYENQVVLANGMLLIHWAREKRYYKGLADRERFERYLAISLDADSVVRLLSGGVLLEAEEDYRLQSRKKGTEWVLRGSKSELVLAPQGTDWLPVRQTLLDVDGSRRAEIVYSDYFSGCVN